MTQCLFLLHLCLHVCVCLSCRLEQCYYEAYVRLYVIKPLNLQRSGFLPPAVEWPEIAPTENDTTWRHITMQVRARV